MQYLKEYEKGSGSVFPRVAIMGERVRMRRIRRAHSRHQHARHLRYDDEVEQKDWALSRQDTERVRGKPGTVFKQNKLKSKRSQSSPPLTKSELGVMLNTWLEKRTDRRRLNRPGR